MQGSIERKFKLDTDRHLRIIASDVRRERTGIHAKIMIAVNDTMLAWTNFNVERDEDRNRLANSAHKALPKVEQECYPQEQMRRTLSMFCVVLWDELVGNVEIGDMAGARRKEGPAFACRPYVIEGGGTIVYAPPGRGKSFSAMLQAVSVDAGNGTLFDVSVPRKTLYINIERAADSMADRLARINDCLGLPEERPLAFINARGRSLHDIADAIRKYVDREGVEVAYLDSISRAGFGDLNENQPVNKIIDTLNSTVKTWVALAHTPRSDESHVYGSVHFEAGIDIGVKMTTEVAQGGQTIGVAWTVTKANDAPTGGKPLMYALDFDETGLMAVRMPRAGEFLQLDGTGNQTAEAKIQRLLLEIGEASATTVSTALGMNRSHTADILSAAKWATKRRAGKEVLYAVRDHRYEEPVG